MEDDMLDCPTCRGAKVMPVTVTEATGTRSLDITCIDCEGEGQVTRLRHDRIMAMREAINNMWCRCRLPAGSSYHPDAPGTKHHWTCDACGKGHAGRLGGNPCTGYGARSGEA